VRGGEGVGGGRGVTAGDVARGAGTVFGVVGGGFEHVVGAVDVEVVEKERRKSVSDEEKGKKSEGNARNDDASPSNPDEDNSSDVDGPLVVLQRRAEVESGGLVGNFLRDMNDASGFAGDHVLREAVSRQYISTRVDKGRGKRREGKEGRKRTVNPTAPASTPQTIVIADASFVLLYHPA
jgi:hypothetical protein